ncbi:MAG: alpha/beta hydrolase-fold protein [Aquirufa sp.]|jgi:predicted peptidase
MKKILVLLLFAFVAQAQSSFEKKSFETKEGQVLPYQILLPKDFKPGKKYPLLVVLHGAGERGTDNEAQMKYGKSVFLDSLNRINFPAIVIFPQCPKESYWSSVKINRSTVPTTFIFDYSAPINWPLQAVIDLVKSIKHDKKRTYIMGLSMGGMGTMEAVSRNPKMFAAASPICGGADLSYVPKYAKRVPLWVHHGDADIVVPVRHSRELVKAVQDQGVDIRYTEYPGVNHNSWDNAFKQPDLLSWIFSHRK